MNVWIITIFEPLPYGHPKTRPQRCGMLTRSLLKKGHNVVLWTSNFEHNNHKHYFRGNKLSQESDRLSIQYLDGYGYSHDISLKRIFHNHKTAHEFHKIARKHQFPPDVIFAPIPSLELAEAAVKFAKEKVCPIVVDIRDLWPDVYLSVFKGYFKYFARIFIYPEILRAKRILKGATSITAVSERYLKWGLDYAGREKLISDQIFHLGFIDNHNGDFNSNSDLIDIKKLYGIDDNKCLVIFVGSFSDFYDIKCIFDAAKILSEDGRAHFLIVGSGKDEIKFHKLAQSLPNLTMTGWIDFQDVCKLLKVSDIGLVAYSKNATMSLPNKPFEYMAFGLPLLSSLKGELESIIRENKIGKIYEAGNPITLAKEILWFIDNMEIARSMGDASLKLFESKYSERIIYDKFSSYIENIAEIKW